MVPKYEIHIAPMVYRKAQRSNTDCTYNRTTRMSYEEGTVLFHRTYFLFLAVTFYTIRCSQKIEDACYKQISHI